MEASDSLTVTGTVSPPPFFTLDLSPKHPLRNFATLADVKDWLLNEQKFFSFMDTTPPLRNTTSPYADVAPQFDLFSGALSRIEQIEANPGNAEVIANNLRKVQSHLRTHYVESSQCLMSDDPRAHFVAKLWADGQPTPRVAAWMLNVFMGRHGQMNMNDPLQFEGALRASMFNLGLQGSADAEGSALMKLRKDYHERIEALDIRRRDLTTATETATAGANKSATDRAKEFADAQQGRIDDFVTLRDNWNTTFDQQSKAFNEHMSIKAPVTYWKKKATRHAIWGGVFAFASIGFLGLYMWAAVSALPGFIDLLQTITRAATPLGTDGSHAQSIPIYVALFAVALIGIWLMRILVRITLSHIHLGTDAKHRSVCVESYLALLSTNEKAIGADERKIILTQLFRPTSDGLVKDDAMPPTLFERITSNR